VPDDVSGRKATSFQFVFYPSSFICGHLRESAVKKMLLTADGRRRWPDDMSGPKAARTSNGSLPFLNFFPFAVSLEPCTLNREPLLGASKKSTFHLRPSSTVLIEMCPPVPDG